MATCGKALACGHACGGTRGEQKCPPCFKPVCFRKAERTNIMLNPICPICLGTHDEEPSIQLECTHVYHFDCLQQQIKSGWHGNMMTFEFLNCSKCLPVSFPIKHHLLATDLAPMQSLRAEVTGSALQRLKAEGLMGHALIKTLGNRFYNDPPAYALSRYAYYRCYKCKKPYFGGTMACDAADSSSTVDPSTLLCGACSFVQGTKSCPKHGADYITYKCRFCCSAAVYYCFGTTHFCKPCHDQHSTMQTMQTQGKLPPCPAGSVGVRLSGLCPLGVPHPPTGQEFAFSCGRCLMEKA